jgi:ArsR family transcriptional regulator
MTVKREREAAAQTYFRDHAAEWDRIRSLHVTESEVEAAVRDALGPGPFGLLVDLGTGTGRMLELLADRYERGLGLDINHTMLAYARGKLEAAGIGHASVRHGDLYEVAIADGTADAVVMHQVLHFLAEPMHAIREAARILGDRGRLAIIDFAPHAMEFLREDFAHERLGFPGAQVEQWLAEAGLVPDRPRLLSPAEGEGAGKLTVTVWTAARPAAARRPGVQARRNKVEA